VSGKFKLGSPLQLRRISSRNSQGKTNPTVAKAPQHLI
jgi:hypothetical protein